MRRRDIRSSCLPLGPTGLAVGLAQKDVALRRHLAAIRPRTVPGPLVPPLPGGLTARELGASDPAARHSTTVRRWTSLPSPSRPLEAATRGLEPPFAVVDLDAFDANAAALLGAGGGEARAARDEVRALRARSWRGRSRRASAACSPSRCPRRCGSTSTGREDVVVGYPTTDAAALAAAAGRPITLMADCEAHLDAAPPGGRVCLDVDAGWRPLGGRAADRRPPLARAHARGGGRAGAGGAGARPRRRRADGLRGADRRGRRPAAGPAALRRRGAGHAGRLGAGAGRAARRGGRRGAGRRAAALRQRRRHGLRGPHGRGSRP